MGQALIEIILGFTLYIAVLHMDRQPR